MKFVLSTVLVAALLVVSSCGGKDDKIIAISSSGENLPDCTGKTSTMIIPFGFTGSVSSKMGGATFARLTAVDSVDGTMKITITPPDGGKFPADFINEFRDRKLRFIACREDTSSVGSGSSTTGVCSRSGSINIVGVSGIDVGNFTTIAFVTGQIKVHATRSPEYDIAYNYALKPDFIMLTASTIDGDDIGDVMLAYGRSPYYTGCYSR